MCVILSNTVVSRPEYIRAWTGHTRVLNVRVLPRTTATVLARPSKKKASGLDTRDTFFHLYVCCTDVAKAPL